MSEEIKWLKSLDNFKAHLDSLERLHSNFKQQDVWQIPYNPIQNIWNKIQKSSNIGQEEKSLMSIFEWFLLAIAKIEFLEEKLGTRIWDFKSYVGRQLVSCRPIKNLRRASLNVDATLHIIYGDAPYYQLTNLSVNDSLLILYYSS